MVEVEYRAVDLQDDATPQVEDDRTRMLYRQAPGALVVAASAATGLVAAHAHTWDTRAALWGLAMFTVVAARVGLVVWFRRRVAASSTGLERWAYVHAAGVLLSGALFAVWPPLFFPTASVPERLLTALVLGGTAGGAVALLSVRRRLALAYAALMLVPVSILLLWQETLPERIAGALGVLYWLTMVVAISTTHRSIVDALRFSRRNERLLVVAAEQRAATAAAHAELARAQRALEQTNRDLEGRIAERTQDLRRLAAHDSLTGLANRAQLIQLAERLLAPGSDPFVLFFLDLDGFKEVNDSFGHAVGDMVLRAVGQRLTVIAPEALAVARWGGDEFVIVVPRDDRREREVQFAHALLGGLREPIDQGSLSVRVDGCIGMAFWPEDASTLDALIQGADLAVYAAKATGPGQVRRYDEELAVGARRQARLKQALGQALSRHDEEIRLSYQPIHDLRRGHLVSVEALVRWRHPEYGEIPPAEFIPLAEQGGDIMALGDLVLHAACRFLASVPASLLPEVAVNVSARQLKDPRFALRVEHALSVTGLDPHRLTLELTESAFATDPDQLESVMRGLGRHGIRFAIDDFGTGYSSLAYLQRLPASTLKIDRSFVNALDGTGRPIIEASLSLASAFEMEVIAEGVETEAQARTLMALGIDRLQGFYVGRPMTEAHLRDAITGAGPAGVVPN